MLVEIVWRRSTELLVLFDLEGHDTGQAEMGKAVKLVEQKSHGFDRDLLAI